MCGCASQTGSWSVGRSMGRFRCWQRNVSQFFPLLGTIGYEVCAYRSNSIDAKSIDTHTHTRMKWKKRSIIPYLLCLSIHLTRKVHRLAEMKIERLSFVPSPERPNGMPNCYGRCWAIIICRTGFMLLFQEGVCFHSVRVVGIGWWQQTFRCRLVKIHRSHCSNQQAGSACFPFTFDSKRLHDLC